jgi:hypothetical protein
MEQEHELSDYRGRLLQALTRSARRSACGTASPIHVFINDRRVGVLNGAGNETTLQMVTHFHIDSVYLRSEDGVLLGGLSAPEFGFRSRRIPLSSNTIELRIHNNAQGGSVSAGFLTSPGLWSRAWRTMSDLVSVMAMRPANAIVPRMRVIAFTQVLLAAAVIGLASDRMTSWLTPERVAPPVTPKEAPWAAPLAEVTKLEQQLGDLTRMQAKVMETIQTQQQGMTQIQRTMTKLSSTQETVVSSVLTVKQEMEQQRKGSGRDMDRVKRLLMTKAQTEQEQLEAEIHSLTVANDKLSKEMENLEQNNLDLKKKLKSAGLDVSRSTVSDPEQSMMARRTEVDPKAQSPQAVEARPGLARPSPTTFLISGDFD